MIKTMEVTVAEVEGIPVNIRFQLAGTKIERGLQEQKVEKVISVIQAGLQLFAEKQKMTTKQMPDRQPRRIIVARG